MNKTNSVKVKYSFTGNARLCGFSANHLVPIRR